LRDAITVANAESEFSTHMCELAFFKSSLNKILNDPLRKMYVILVKMDEQLEKVIKVHLQ